MAELTQQELIFGLDIGTRSIVGTVGYKDGSRFHIVAQKVLEHQTRAMMDGQIHDIAKVAESISKMKEMLQEELGQKLTQVCIAAAGRVLRTITTHVTHEYAMDKEINSEDIYALDTMGVEKAYEDFVAQNDTGMQFYCVGYTAMRYYLNGYVIGNLEGHKAKNIGVDLIATFLPDDVVDGLYKAVGMAGLSVANLTLEPIAAIQIAIPEKFRMLNLALVDVGAGTSDISITKEGTITAYGMIPVAGDSLTEEIMQKCLVDFDTAENIKRDYAVKDSMEYVDILGLPHKITATKIRSLLKDHLKEMAHQVAEEIKLLNGDKPVSAVFVVGGGGIIKGYTDFLAKELGIGKERVAIRGQEVMQDISFDIDNAIKDSLMVTPIGICLSYYEQSNNFIFVNFNGQRIKLYDNGKLTIVDAAIAAGFPNDALFPKRGNALEYKVDGKSHMIRGQQGEAAVLKLNGKECDIHAAIQNGDKIELISSTRGEDARMSLDQLPEYSRTVKVSINGVSVSLPFVTMVNGNRELGTYEIKNGDDIVFQNWYTVEQIAEFADIPIPSKGFLLVNEVPAKRETKVYDDFEIEIPLEDEEFAVDITESQSVEITVVVNNQPVTLTGKAEYVFVDIFDHIDFDLTSSKGRSIVTLKNGQPSGYMESLSSGDEISVYWKDM